MNYSWIAILVNVPATLFATAYYEFLMRDSLSKIAGGHATHEEGEEGLHRHITRTVSLYLPFTCSSLSPLCLKLNINQLVLVGYD